jgi:hypothetical protein
MTGRKRKLTDDDWFIILDITIALLAGWFFGILAFPVTAFILIGGYMVLGLIIQPQWARYQAKRRAIEDLKRHTQYR